MKTSFSQCTLSNDILFPMHVTRMFTDYSPMEVSLLVKRIVFVRGRPPLISFFHYISVVYSLLWQLSEHCVFCRPMYGCSVHYSSFIYRLFSNEKMTNLNVFNRLLLGTFSFSALTLLVGSFDPQKPSPK